MENTGYKRSLTIIVNKFGNGVQAVGYPKTYEGRNAFTCPSPYTLFPAIDNSTFANMDEVAYGIRLSSFRTYVESVESNLDFGYAPTTNEAIIFDEITCHL